MKRKIVQHGSSSLTITLPMKWAEKFSLKKGDEVNVEENGPVLFVSTEKEIASPKKEVITTESGAFTKNDLSHLYHLGYDEIEIKYNDAKTPEDIKKRLPDCMGFEIIDQKPNKIYIKSIATTIESEFDNLLRKSFMITNEMAKEMLEILQKKELKNLKEVRSLEALNNKFTDICTRILNKKGYKVPKRTMQMYEIVKNIERIADEFKYICDLYSENAKKVESEYVKVFGEAVEYYLSFYEMFYNFNPKLKQKIYSEREKLLKKYESMLEKSKGRDSRFLHHLMNIIQKTYDGANGYFALVL